MNVDHNGEMGSTEEFPIVSIDSMSFFEYSLVMSLCLKIDISLNILVLPKRRTEAIE